MTAINIFTDGETDWSAWNCTEKEVVDKEIKQVKETGLNCYRYVFFSRAGFNCDESDEIGHIDIKELYK